MSTYKEIELPQTRDFDRPLKREVENVYLAVETHLPDLRAPQYRVRISDVDEKTATNKGSIFSQIKSIFNHLLNIA